MTLACLLPAAGASSRMRGGDKLLELVDGKPCLATLCERAIDAGLDVITTLPHKNHPRTASLAHLTITKIYVEDAVSRGMSASLVHGAAALPETAKGLMVLPPDMPDIQSGDMKTMADAFLSTQAKILRARTASGRAGHPIVFSTQLVREFSKLTGDIGAQSIVKRHIKDIQFFDFKDERALLDLDTPEDWAAWRQSPVRD